MEKIYTKRVMKRNMQLDRNEQMKIAEVMGKNVYDNLNRLNIQTNWIYVRVKEICLVKPPDGNPCVFFEVGFEISNFIGVNATWLINMCKTVQKYFPVYINFKINSTYERMIPWNDKSKVLYSFQVHSLSDVMV